MTFNIPKPKPPIDIDDDIKPLYLFKEIERPSEWAKNHFHLGKGYGEQGQISFEGREWQPEILDAYMKYKTVIVCGPVQVGKSICAIDIPWAWWNDMVGGRSLIIYDSKEKAEDVFDERIKDNVKTNLHDLWSGDDDDLKLHKITLLNGITRCGSSNVENDFATFPADLVLLDELAKFYQGEPSGRSSGRAFAVVDAARGRQMSFKGMPGLHGILGICSSPKRHGDPLYNEIHKGGVLVLRYQMPCPNCNKYHELIDENIKEIANDKGEMDHNPVRIRVNNAAVYECPNCKHVISDMDRWKMLKKGRWLAENEEIGADGEINNENPLRKKSDEICFWFNRLVSMPDKWKFADCLSSFFAARASADPKSWQIYQNEQMARFINPKTEKVSFSFLLSKCQEYYQFGELARVPNDVLIMFCGMDTQDDGFYYVVRGFGKGMTSWLIRSDFIKCDMKDSINHDPMVVLNTIKSHLYGTKYVKNTGEEMGIFAGLIDEGGHRQKDVQFICKNLRIFKPYKGSSMPNADSIKQSKTGDHYMGNTRQLSELVQKYMESDTWYLPKDVSKQYLEQVVKQFWEEERDRAGNLKYKWYSGGNDHYRDCENYIMGLVLLYNLSERLNDEGRTRALVNAVESNTEKYSAYQEENKPKVTKESAPKREDPTAYRDKLRHGRRFI